MGGPSTRRTVTKRAKAKGFIWDLGGKHMSREVERHQIDKMLYTEGQKRGKKK